MVYAITCGCDGPTKIGRTATLRLRLDSLQVGSWQELRIGYVGAFYAKPYERRYAHGMGECFETSARAAQVIEKRSHYAMKDMGLHIRGEWFDISAVDAGLVVEKIAAQNGMVPMVGDEFLNYINLYGLDGRSNRAKRQEVMDLVRSLEFGIPEMERFLREYKDAA